MDLAPVFAKLLEDTAGSKGVVLLCPVRPVIIKLNEDRNWCSLKRPSRAKEARLSNRAITYADMTWPRLGNSAKQEKH